jgi:hypothetical protein
MCTDLQLVIWLNENLKNSEMVDICEWQWSVGNFGY